MYFGDTGGNYCCEGSVCVEQHDDCFANSGSWHGCSLGCLSPILIDVNGDGFALTDAAGGVDFDPAATGTKERLSWTALGSDDAWLVLDRNGNGTIDSAFELFGNYTDQDLTVGKNGFAALAMFDKLNGGGNADGKITRQDVIFGSLRLWQDTNHNGISEPEELHTLPELGINQIDLDYKTSKRTDEFGNRFKYRSKVNATGQGSSGRWAWDVFLLKR